MPPSSFRQNTLRPIGAKDAEKANRRVSRTDLDFEQALETGTTLRLSEGMDVSTMGVDPSPSPKSPRIPASPTVVPPTPSPAQKMAAPVSVSTAGPAHALKTATPSPDSSSTDIFYDASEDPDVQTKRRSMFRSPGMASSPDLATLVRKAKEKARMNEVAPPNRADAPHTPSLQQADQDSPKPRQRSATSSATPAGFNLANAPPMPRTPNRLTKSPSVATLGGSPDTRDWVMTGGRSPSLKDIKVSSVSLQTMLTLNPSA